MNGEYLSDPEAAPDAEVQDLERALRPFRYSHVPILATLGARPVPTPAPGPRRIPELALAFAAGVMLTLGLARLWPAEPPPPPVVPVAGAPAMVPAVPTPPAPPAVECAECPECPPIPDCPPEPELESPDLEDPFSGPSRERRSSRFRDVFRRKRSKRRRKTRRNESPDLKDPYRSRDSERKTGGSAAPDPVNTPALSDPFL